MLTPNVDQGTQKLELSYISGKNIRWYSYAGKVWQFLKKKRNVTMYLLYNLSFTLLGIYPWDMRTCSHKTSTGMYIAFLFVVAKNWIQPRCPSVGEWLTNYSNSYCGILFSSKKRMNYWCTQQLGWISRVLYWVKKPISKCYILFIPLI